MHSVSIADDPQHSYASAVQIKSLSMTAKFGAVSLVKPQVYDVWQCRDTGGSVTVGRLSLCLPVSRSFLARSGSEAGRPNNRDEPSEPPPELYGSGYDNCRRLG